MPESYFQRGQGRVFLQPYGPHPDKCFEYQGCAKVEGAEEPLGDITELQCPDPSAYDEFEVVDEIRGAGGPVTTTMVARFGMVNPILELRCPFDLAVNFGKCKDPSDFNGGWEKGIYFNRARLTTRSLSELSALTEEDRAEILITGAISARKLYQVDPIAFSEYAKTLITGEVVAVVICDTPSCGECDVISGGCQKVYAVCSPKSLASPGLPSEVVYTLDGGATFAEVDITTLGAAEAPTDAACIGGMLVVISADSDSLHYAYLTDIGTWVEVGTGFVLAGKPNAIWSVDARHTWIVGDDGYIYFAEDPTAGVVVQDAGIAAAGEDLNDVHFLDTLRGIAVGDNNTVVFTTNGGVTWAAIALGPHPAAILLACRMLTEKIWFVGDDAGGLWYTVDGGTTWTQKMLPVANPFAIHDIVFFEAGFGWLSIEDDSTAGHILRTRDGGCTWYELPESRVGSLPANDRINMIAPCDQNTIWAGGLADDGADGILVLGS
jgi:photosystem II stability/assembly factor-like uncharacterized protein